MLLVFAAAATAMFSGATAAMAQGAPIGPNQFFIGLVNGNHTNALIYMVCPGPSFSGQTGHPESGRRSVSLRSTSHATR